MNTDPISDLLTRIRNASSAKQVTTTAPYSKVKEAVLEVLKKNKFIKGYKKVKDGNFDALEIELNTELNTINLKRVSKPGQRIYIKKAEIKPVLNGYGISVLSTPKGVMSGSEAYKAGLGGEFICKVW